MHKLFHQISLTSLLQGDTNVWHVINIDAALYVSTSLSNIQLLRRSISKMRKWLIPIQVSCLRSQTAHRAQLSSETSLWCVTCGSRCLPVVRNVVKYSSWSTGFCFYSDTSSRAMIWVTASGFLDCLVVFSVPNAWSVSQTSALLEERILDFTQYVMSFFFSVSDLSLDRTVHYHLPYF